MLRYVYKSPWYKVSNANTIQQIHTKLGPIIIYICTLLTMYSQFISKNG